MEKDLAGKVIVLTGASSGIGKGAALELARAGASLVLAARRSELLDELARDCESAGGQALALPTDVSQKGEMETLARAAVARFGRMDVWINDAGGAALGRFEDVPLDAHVQVIETDLLGALYGSYLALHQFHTQETGGILINVASALGKVPTPYMASYVAAKHGIVGLSAALRQELDVFEVKNIRICTLMPASMDTPFFTHEANYSGKAAVPIPPVYDAQDGVNVLVGLVRNPRDEATVGALGAAGGILSHNLAPHLTEKGMAKNTDMALDKAGPASDTPGNLDSDTSPGTGVSGGFKK